MFLILINLCCFLLIIASLFMLLSINPVNSVFFLIFIFFLSSILFILLNGDLIGIIILIIYIGAIAVLFLFIVMIINIKRIEKDSTTYLIVGTFLLLMLIVQLYYLIIYFFFDFSLVAIVNSQYNFTTNVLLDETNKKYILTYIGFFIFFKYPIFVVCSVFILIIGMIASIFLTNFKSGFSFRKQYNQLSRNENIYSMYIY